MVIIQLIVALSTCFALVKGQVRWQPGDWALDCDFQGNDLQNVRSSGDKCGGLCAANPKCTHFTHNNFQGGTCWMKQGGAQKSQAVVKNGVVCGIVRGGSPNPNPNPNPNPGPDPTPIKGPGLGCDFRFGRAFDGKDKDYSAVDYILIWVGEHGQWNNYWHGDMLRTAKQYNKLPMFMGYNIAFKARTEWGLKDCDMGTPNLCQRGSAYIRAKRADIISTYRMFAAESAKIIGRDGNMVWLIEPDFWQYYGDTHQEGGPLSGEYMRSLYDDIAVAIKSELPNAKLSWDISAWLSEDAMRRWWSFFATSPHISFLHTSGGQSQPFSEQIKSNELRWQFLSSLTGKKIIADTGYGVGGAKTGHNRDYDDINNLRNRIQNGVIAVTQDSPKGDWKNTLDYLRANLPKLC